MSDQFAGPKARRVVRFFPLSCRKDLVRRSAEELDRHNGQAAVDFWRATCRLLADELIAQGCPEAEMRQQIVDFQAAVQAELLALHMDRAWG